MHTFLEHLNTTYLRPVVSGLWQIILPPHIQQWALWPATQRATEQERGQFISPVSWCGRRGQAHLFSAGPSWLCPQEARSKTEGEAKRRGPSQTPPCLLPAHTEPQRARVGKGQRSGLITSTAPLRFWKNSTNQIIIPSPKIWQNVLSAVSGTKRTTVTSG